MTYPEASKYRVDAVRDGWTIEPTYSGHEPVEKAATLEKEGFTMSIIARGGSNNMVTIWAPDLCQIEVPYPYSWEKIKENIKRCLGCHRLVEETVQVGFAGRYCTECAPDERKKQEFPGWTS